jgi:glycerol-3-phosphate dehydrogenase
MRLALAREFRAAGLRSDREIGRIIVGGGIGGVIWLKYAGDAGLSRLLLERREPGSAP